VCIWLIDGPLAKIRVDPGPAFTTIVKKDQLSHLKITLEVDGATKPKKNPAAEHAISDLQFGLKRGEPSGGIVSPASLDKVCSHASTRLHLHGLSFYKMLFEKDQFSNTAIPINNLDLITNNTEPDYGTINAASAPKHVPE